MSLKRGDKETVEPGEFVNAPPFPEKVYSHALYILGFITFTVVVGIFIMAYTGKTFENDGLIAIGSASVGGIVGIFASNNKSK